MWDDGQGGCKCKRVGCLFWDAPLVAICNLDSIDKVAAQDDGCNSNGGFYNLDNVCAILG
eukprot:695167-Ditylum_brightwellii.AAC.1